MRNTRAIFQGITGQLGSFDTERMVEYGTKVVSGKSMGHAGATITGERGSYEAKAKAFEKAGVPVAKTMWDLGELVKEVI